MENNNSLFSWAQTMAPNIIGKLPSGKPIVRNDDGSISTHRNSIVNFDDDYYIMPTLYGGKQHTVDEAVALMKKSNFIDPDTGKALNKYPSLEEAEKAEGSQHNILNEIASLLSRGTQR